MEKRIKQVIILRKDLNMRKGKIAAQAAHASLAIFFNMMRENPLSDSNKGTFLLEVKNKYMLDWINGHFVKICLYVNSEQELISVFEKAKNAGLPAVLIKDAGFTEFNVPTYTSVAIGPDDPEKIDEITKNLPLY